jgi:hypothetical protein
MPNPKPQPITPSPPDKRDWRPWLFNLALLGGAACLVLLGGWWAEAPFINGLFQTPTPMATATATFSPMVTFALLQSAAATSTPPPTSTSTRVVQIGVDRTATGQAGQRATAEAGEAARARELLAAMLPTPHTSRPAGEAHYTAQSRLVLAQYFAWYDAAGWNDCNISAGDKPLQPYSSDDPLAITRHLKMAVDAGLDGFTLHWFAPGDRTDRNFETLLKLSQGVNFYSTVVFSRHIWPGAPAPSRQNIAAAIEYVLDKYSSQPNFLTVDGKPVLLFVDMYRVPAAAGQSPQQFWVDVRNEVDPQHQSWWLAEGLDPTYLDVFDGLYVFKITHAAYPDDYLKDSRWAARVRQWQHKLWLATISPGWYDLRAGCKTDVRVPNQPHHRDRQDGALYLATFNAALQSQPDWLIISSFNEWVEGTYIEPSVQYGDKYMQMTKEFVKRFKAR